MNMNSLDIFGKLRKIISCCAYHLLNLENFKKSEGLSNLKVNLTPFFTVLFSDFTAIMENETAILLG